MATLQEILARAQALREETALGSISPERAGSIMYDTLQQINQMQLEGGSLVISKIYESVAAMQADTTPVSDLTGQDLRQGQLVVIVPSDTSSSDLGSVYRYNGTTEGASSWSFTGKIGGYPMDQTPTQGSTRAVTSGGVYEQITQLGQFFVYDNPVKKDNGGIQTSTPTFRNTGFLPIKSYCDIVIRGYDGGGSYNYTICAFYDENKAFISSYPNNTAGMQTVSIPASSIPSGAAFIRCTTRTSDIDGSYVSYRISKVLAELQNEANTKIEETQTRLNALSLSQHGVLNYADASIVANARLQQYIPTENKTVRFRVNILSGTPSVSSFMVYGGTESAPLGSIVLRGCQFGEVYTCKIGSAHTGITVRSNASTSAFSARVELLDVVSDDAKIDELERYKGVKTLYDLGVSPAVNGRIQLFLPCSGALRITVSVTSGTPSGSTYRVFYGTESAPSSRIAVGSTGYGNTVEVFISEDYGFTGVTIFTVTADSGSVAYNILVEKLDTEEEKREHRERILCIGDSITQFNGQNVTGQGAVRDGMRYSDYMQILRPGISLTNVGISGTRLAQRTATLQETPTDQSHAYAALDMVNLVGAICTGDFTYQDAAVSYLGKFSDIIARAKSVEISKIDAVTILGGTNDWANDQALGDVDDTAKTTTLGALNTIISALLSARPRLRIYVVLPPVRYKGSTFTHQYWCDVFKNANNQTLLELCQSIEGVAAKNYIPVIDIHRTLGWNEQNFWTFFISPDGTHPIAGFKRIAEKIMHDIILY